jgi:predicted MPP superfamily phosphohydrolase
LLTSLLSDLTQDTKFIFLTGDYVHSGVWFYSPEENSKQITQVVERLAAAFPDVPVFPLTGNK